MHLTNNVIWLTDTYSDKLDEIDITDKKIIKGLSVSNVVQLMNQEFHSDIEDIISEEMELALLKLQIRSYLGICDE